MDSLALLIRIDELWIEYSTNFWLDSCVMRNWRLGLLKSSRCNFGVGDPEDWIGFDCIVKICVFLFLFLRLRKYLLYAFP